MPSIEIRAATRSDLPGLNEIYNHYVLNTHMTFDVEPITSDARSEWFSHYDTTGRYRIFVAVEEGLVKGYASSSRWRPRQAYETSVETSVYLAPADVGLGLGPRLYEGLFRALEGEDVHRAYAGIALPNEASIALHERFGFRQVAHFTEQGRKFGRFWDVAWFEKSL
ncbi:MAG: N-acetyltransferase family protein [Actinomycetota bacterium]|nr:N-acetyltransferase family protein [Actinomycetota bacterium]